MAEKDTRKIVAENRKARHNYFIEDSLEAGIVLEGSEVKSLREGQANIGESYASVEGGELWLINCHIPKYRQAKADDELLARLVEIPWFRSAQFLGTYRGFRQSGPVSSELKRRFFYPDREKLESVADSFGNPIDYATFRDLH